MARIKKVTRFKRSLLDDVSTAKDKETYYKQFLKWLDEHFDEFTKLGIQDDLGMFVGLTANELPINEIIEVSVESEKEKLEAIRDDMKAGTFTMLMRSKLWRGLVYLSDKTCPQCGEHELLGVVEGINNNEPFYECETCGLMFRLSGERVPFRARRPASRKALVAIGMI